MAASPQMSSREARATSSEGRALELDKAAAARSGESRANIAVLYRGNRGSVKLQNSNSKESSGRRSRDVCALGKGLKKRPAPGLTFDNDPVVWLPKMNVALFRRRTFRFGWNLE